MPAASTSMSMPSYAVKTHLTLLSLLSVHGEFEEYFAIFGALIDIQLSLLRRILEQNQNFYVPYHLNRQILMGKKTISRYHHLNDLVCFTPALLVCNVNIVNGNFKFENPSDYAQKPQQNCTFMNSALGFVLQIY